MTISPAKADGLFSLAVPNELQLDPIAATAITNAVTLFKKNTGQDIRNFTIGLSKQNRHLVVSITANRAPGERGLGGVTSLGYSMVYYVSPRDGEIVRELGQR